MSLRIRWKTSHGEGSFPLRGAALHLVWSDGDLDRIQKPMSEADGLTIDLPDGEGKLGLEGWGDLQFRSGSRTFRKVRLPVGGAVQFDLRGEIGRIQASGEVPAQDPLVGREIGGYKILSRLGAGAVGVVYRANQTSLDREVALKILNPKVAQDPAAVRSFRKEAQAAGRFSHPNLVQVHDVSEQEGLNFYSMELVPGGTLEDKLKEHGPLSWREGVAAVLDCARALDYADEHHLLHRDIKPENLMVTANGHVKLADLGLAATRGMIDKEAAGGTPHFMAPEAVTQKDVDHRADLYSLGCTFYRLLTGETPFNGDSVKEILRAHRDDPAPTFKQAGVQTPKEVEELLAWLLAKEPTDRPEHASALVQECEQILRHGRSTRSKVLVLGGLLILVGAFALFQALNKEPEAEPETVIKYETDPNAAETEAELAKARMELAFTKAMSVSDEDQRIANLEEFLTQFGDSAKAADARNEIKRIEEARKAAAEAEAERAAAKSQQYRQLEQSVAEYVQSHHYSKALAAIAVAEGLEEDEIQGFRQQVETAAEEHYRAWEEQHAQAVEERNWDAAAMIRADYQALLEADPPAEDATWPGRYAALVESAETAEREVRIAAYRQSRNEFLQALHGHVENSTLNMNAQKAAEHYDAAVGEIAHTGLLSAAQADQHFFKQAGKASAALRERVRNGEEITFVEPISGKRAIIQDVRREGLLLQVQVRGERTDRLDAWSTYYTPENFYGFLRAAMSPDVADEAVIALHFLIAEAHLAQQVRAWGGELPDKSAAARLGAETRSWLAMQPRRLEVLPPWLAPHQQALDHLAGFCEALAEEDDYLAFLRLDDLMNHYSLLAAWCSNGEGELGIDP